MAKSRITIVGLGLIGGSLGLALQRGKTNFEIMGHDLDHAVAGRAQKLGAVDRTDWNLISACEGADLIFIATPVMAIKETLSAIAPYLKPGCIVTDTATTKWQVMRWAKEILPDTVNFVGGDPLVSKEGTGIDAASADLFTGALYCLIPLPDAEPEAVRLLADLVSLIGARPYFIEAAEHDGLVAGVDHLPFILSTALLNATSRSASWREMRRMASYTFREATRFASDDPHTYRDICLTNRQSIVRWIDACLESLREVRELVAAEDGEGLESLFTEMLATRGKWLQGVDEEQSEARRALEEAGRRGLRELLFGSRF
ncbi:MAG TPA: prephenate dehydrogenase/arogenate dehydrogenase family protein [Anaerolineae bacterium]|nr:prephenate dehydrogenase/arogenate dehydrogenase family protein [Anaerolineae bacterium]